MTRIQRLKQNRAAIPPEIETVEDKLPQRPRRARPPVAVPAAPAPPVGNRTETSIDTAPLHLFDLSELNVRKAFGEAEIDEMARDIELRGQLQNLVAVVSEDGRLAVIAGGRRLRALWKLRDAGKVDPAHLVAFRLAPGEDARETSLAENIHTVALNPADAIEAYAAIVAEHADQPDPLAYCAARQGVSRTHVERMLRLATLAPPILDALRGGEIELSSAQAYGTTSDHAVQLLVFDGEMRRQFGSKHLARTVRDSIRGRAYPADIAQAHYVGLDAYRAAGGRVDRDLFLGTDAGELLLDPSILDQLAREKAQAELPRQVERDGFASGLLTKGFNAMPQWPATPADHRVGGRVQDPATMAAKPAFAVRPTAIGVYTLQGRALAPIGWFEPNQAPASAAASDVPPTIEEPAVSAQARPSPEPISHLLPTPRQAETAEAMMERLRERSIQRRAAALAARAVAAASLPADRLVPPTIEDEPQVLDDGDLIVTIQLRVHPAELEAQRAAATEQLGDDA